MGSRPGTATHKLECMVLTDLMLAVVHARGVPTQLFLEEEP